MGRKRRKHRNLPARVYVHRQQYRYVPKVGKPIPLAPLGDYGGMLRKLAEVLDKRPQLETFAGIFDRYELEVLPDKAPNTQREQSRQLKNLRAVFGHYKPHQLRQPDAARYRDVRANGTKATKGAPTAANREIELLKHVCTMAVEWGALDFNPLRGMRKVRTSPRRRCPTDAEYLHVHALASPMVQCVMDLALLTGLRRGDVLSLTRDCLTDDGLLYRPSKTEDSSGVTLLFEWTDELRAVVDRALSLPPQIRRGLQWIVCNRKGQQFSKNGFDSVWARLMAKATGGQGAIERFEFRDLRRKSATDEVDELVASQRLGHTSTEITNRVYRVSPRKVQPLRRNITQ